MKHAYELYEIALKERNKTPLDRLAERIEEAAKKGQIKFEVEFFLIEKEEATSFLMEHGLTPLAPAYSYGRVGPLRQVFTWVPQSEIDKIFNQPTSNSSGYERIHTDTDYKGRID